MLEFFIVAQLNGAVQEYHPQYIVPTYHEGENGQMIYPKEGEPMYYVPVGRDSIKSDAPKASNEAATDATAQRAQKGVEVAPSKGARKHGSRRWPWRLLSFGRHTAHK